MTALFLTLLIIALITSAALLAGALIFVWGKITMEHVYQLLGLVGTVGTLGLLAYAMWSTYGWWCIAISLGTLAQSFFVIWVVYRKRPTNTSRYRVGGGCDSPRIYR